MNKKVTLEVLRKKDISAAHGWDDPYRLAGFIPAKRSALLNNPLSRSVDDPVQILGLQGNTVIGRVDLIAGELLVKDEMVPILWDSAYYVPEEYRNTLIALLLLRKELSLHHTLGTCGVSQMALPIYKKLNWLDFVQPRFMLVRRSRAVVERYLGASVTLVIKAADAMLFAHGAMLHAAAAVRARNLCVNEVSEMSSDMDEKLRQPRQPVVIHRSAAWINWLLKENFDEDPSRRKGLFYIATPEGHLLGYFLLRMRRFAQASHRGFANVLLGSVHDWLSFDRDQLTDRQIALLAARELGRWNADAVEICTDNAGLQRALRLMGFIHVGKLHTLVYTGRASPLANRFKQQHDWRLRPGDGDNFFQ